MEAGRAQEQSFSRATFRRHLIASLSPFCPDQNILLDVSGEVMDGIRPDAQVPRGEALELIIDAKLAALEKLRAARGIELRVDGLFKKYVQPFLDSGEHAYGWKVFVRELSLLEPLCEFLIVDYYIRERDYPPVAGHWTIRPQCVTSLHDALGRCLGA